MAEDTASSETTRAPLIRALRLAALMLVLIAVSILLVFTRHRAATAPAPDHWDMDDPVILRHRRLVQEN